MVSRYCKSATKSYLTAILMAMVLAALSAICQGQTEKESPQVKHITFSSKKLPPSLFNMYTGESTAPFLSYRLPENYSRDKQYPLIVYVPGFHGKPGGTIRNAIDIAGSRECVVASLPLFKKAVDKSEPAGGLLLSLGDYQVLSQSYRVMLRKLFDEVPNIDFQQSAMAGFSNGAIAIAVLVSMQDEFILEHFHHFCMVDHGMFHLCDLHKSPTKDRRFLILVGDEEDYGRDLKLRGAKLMADSWRLVGVDIESRVLTDTGHELPMSCKKQIGQWIFAKPKTVEEQSP